MAGANQQDPENLQTPENQDGGRPLEVGRSLPDGEDRSYEPSTVQVNRGREQGLGVGQKDIDYQRDATGDRSAQQYSREPDPGGDRGQG